MGQCSPHVHFSTTCLGITIAWEITIVQGDTSVFVGTGVGRIGQSALASNKFMEAGSVLGQGVSSLTWKVEALGTASNGGGFEF